MKMKYWQVCRMLGLNALNKMKRDFKMYLYFCQWDRKSRLIPILSTSSSFLHTVPFLCFFIILFFDFFILLFHQIYWQVGFVTGFSFSLCIIIYFYRFLYILCCLPLTLKSMHIDQSLQRKI